MKSNLKIAAGEISEASTIGLMTHINGDGDAFGSLLALRNVLESLGKKVILFSNEPLPQYLEYLKLEARYKPNDEYIDVDLFIGLDLPVLKRLTIPGFFIKAQESGTKTLIIDHHMEGDVHSMANTVWQKTDISSTSEMIYWLAQELEVKIDKVTAQFLLWGIETDTYFLSTQNVFDSTIEARRNLLALGAGTEEIKENVKASSPTSNKEFMKLVNSRAVEDSKSNSVFTYVTSADKKKFNISTPVSSAVANLLDYQRKSGVIVVAEQRADNVIKVSMRSNHSSVDVAKISNIFGGGGHVKAAGFEVEGEVERDFGNLVEELTDKIVDTSFI